MDDVAPVPKKFKMTKLLWLIAIVIVLIVAAVPSFYFYNQYKSAQELLQNPNQATNEQTQALIVKVGKLIVLPSGEKPTVATVSDITKLSDQPFFQNAQNGDKVLIYTQAKEAILFRESIDKIIQVAPISLGNNLTPSIVPVPSSPTVVPTQTIATPTITPTVSPTK